MTQGVSFWGALAGRDRLGTGRRVEGGGPEESRGATAAKAEVGARLNKTCATGQSGPQAAAARGDPCGPPTPPVAGRPRDRAGGCAPVARPGEWSGGTGRPGTCVRSGGTRELAPRIGWGLRQSARQRAKAGLGCAIQAGGRVCPGEPCLGTTRPSRWPLPPPGWRHLSETCVVANQGLNERRGSGCWGDWSVGLQDSCG